MASIARCMRAARPSSLSVLRLATVSRPAPRKYTKDHEWIDLSADNKTGVIGISEYAAEALGDVVYVELPEEGKEAGAGDAIGAVESVKSAADINAPISCKITHINLELEEKPGTINKVPEDDSAGGGWIAKVTVDEQGVKDFEALMGAEEYKEFTASEDH
ncbi:putative glycine cleavage system h protein [Phaeoacremonium minimum UCRPA7]|uniref:Glycine cleavage system H protein n=1 Tax=Phaeoacremonium minimum (strain UCR-PA7) TaxID=1286976 RepID=R8BDQ1_PHAM7|nr:putative glycine cleavage system h protein [Phaeoacremonium minimum UCRPA7]EON97429.1 putative glycine cleavage system h protein [Phaeoacremonium minimum UCRPA7]